MNSPTLTRCGGNNSEGGGIEGVITVATRIRDSDLSDTWRWVFGSESSPSSRDRPSAAGGGTGGGNEYVSGYLCSRAGYCAPQTPATAGEAMRDTLILGAIVGVPIAFADPVIAALLGLGMEPTPISDGMPGRLPGSALVCRGGLCTADRFAKGSGVTIDAAGNLQGVSVQSASGKTVQ